MGARIDQELGRFFLKDDIRQQVSFGATAQSRGEPAPPLEKACTRAAERVELISPGLWRGIAPISVEDAVRARQSHRAFTRDPLTVDELSFLLWATQGVRGQAGSTVRRTVPSAGARHAFETYLVVSRVTEVRPALYRDLPLEHQLILERIPGPNRAEVVAGANDQRFVGDAAVVFYWTVMPSRMEWRYAEASYKVLAIDAGHVVQNLYLACECIAGGTCAVASYHQRLCDRLLGVDGEEEFTIYLAPVGKVRA